MYGNNSSVAQDLIPEWFPGSRLNYVENLLRYLPIVVYHRT